MATSRLRLRGQPAHTVAELAEAIDVAFGRWDLARLRMFVLQGEIEVSWSAWRDGPAFLGTLDGRSSQLDLLRPGTPFAHVFDLGEDWTHLCAVRPADDRCPAPPLTALTTSDAVWRRRVGPAADRYDAATR